MVGGGATTKDDDACSVRSVCAAKGVCAAVAVAAVAAVTVVTAVAADEVVGRLTAVNARAVVVVGKYDTTPLTSPFLSKRVF